MTRIGIILAGALLGTALALVSYWVDSRVPLNFWDTYQGVEETQR